MNRRGCYIVGILLCMMVQCFFCSGSSAAIGSSSMPKLIPISGYTVDEFYHEIKNANEHGDLNFSISGLQKLEFANEGSYNNYVFTAGGGDAQAMTIVSVYTNRNGYVAKILLSSLAEAPQAKLASYKLEEVILEVLGIERSRVKNFMSDILARDIPFCVGLWTERNEKNITVSHGLDSNKPSIFIIKLTAYDKVFTQERND